MALLSLVEGTGNFDSVLLSIALDPIWQKARI